MSCWCSCVDTCNVCCCQWLCVLTRSGREDAVCVRAFCVGADGVSWRAWPVELLVSRLQSDGISLFTFCQECQQVRAIPCTVQWPCPVYSLLCIVLLVHLVAAPTIASRRHVSNDDCLEDKRENYQKCSVLCCVRQWYTITHTHTWAVLTDECELRFRFSFCAFV